MDSGKIPTKRSFNSDDLKMLEQRREYHPEEMASFIELACLHRKILEQLKQVTASDSVFCHRQACVNRYTKDTYISGCLWDYADGDFKFIIVLGIKNLSTGEWLNRSSAGTSFGVDVYDYISGSRRDDPMTPPVRYDLQRQGDAMIVRCGRYKSQSALPPAGFEVYTYVMWFDTE